MRAFYLLVVVVFVGTFYFVISIPPEIKEVHIVTFSSEKGPNPPKDDASAKISGRSATPATETEAARRQRAYDYEVVTLDQFRREKNAAMAAKQNVADAGAPILTNAPQICMAGFISMFHWSETPHSGESNMGVYLHQEKTRRPVYIFKSKYGKIRCKVDARRIIWGNYNGRWRDHPLDSKIFYEVSSTSVRITEQHKDGSEQLTEHSLKQLQRLTGRESTGKRQSKVEQKLNAYKDEFRSRVEMTNPKPVVTNPIELTAPRQKKTFLEEFQDNWKANKRKARRDANRRTDHICGSLYDTFGSADEFFRGLKCKQDYRKQHQMIYE